MRGTMRGVAATVGALFVLTACAGADTGTPAVDSVNNGYIAQLKAHCTDVVSDDLGEGKLCVDTGFRLDVDRFSFPNWGRSPRADMNVSVQTLVDLFGHSAVCMPGAADECVLRPRTQQKLDEWNVAIGGGRCEGLATLSQRMFLRYETPADYSPTAATVSQLERSNGKLAQSKIGRAHV